MQVQINLRIFITVMFYRHYWDSRINEETKMVYLARVEGYRYPSRKTRNEEKAAVEVHK